MPIKHLIRCFVLAAVLSLHTAHAQVSDEAYQDTGSPYIRAPESSLEDDPHGGAAVGGEGEGQGATSAGERYAAWWLRVRGAVAQALREDTSQVGGGSESPKASPSRLSLSAALQAGPRAGRLPHGDLIFSDLVQRGSRAAKPSGNRRPVGLRAVTLGRPFLRVAADTANRRHDDRFPMSSRLEGWKSAGRALPGDAAYLSRLIIAHRQAETTKKIMKNNNNDHNMNNLPAISASTGQQGGLLTRGNLADITRLAAEAGVRANVTSRMADDDVINDGDGLGDVTGGDQLKRNYKTWGLRYNRRLRGRLPSPPNLSAETIDRIRDEIEARLLMKSGRMFVSAPPMTSPSASPLPTRPSGGTSLSVGLDLDALSRLIASQRKGRLGVMQAHRTLLDIGRK